MGNRMYATDTIKMFSMTSCKKNPEEGVAVLDTIGERIDHLLRTGGKSDRGTEYEQQELAAWLSGDALAPNGKRYNVAIDSSGVNRLVRDKTKRPSLDALYAICDIFHVDMEWLTRGRSLAVADDRGNMSDEADQIAALVDGMDKENRDFVLSMVRHISNLDNETRQLDIELAIILARNIDRMPEQDQPRIRLLLSQIQSRKLASSGSGAF